MTPHLHQWPAQGRVHHGIPLAEALPREIRDASRIALVTTRSLAGGTLVAAARAAIGDRLAAGFAAMRAHSPVEDVLALAALLREQEADLVVAIGGGVPFEAPVAASASRLRRRRAPRIAPMLHAATGSNRASP